MGTIILIERVIVLTKKRYTNYAIISMIVALLSFGTALVLSLAPRDLPLDTLSHIAGIEPHEDDAPYEAEAPIIETPIIEAPATLHITGDTVLRYEYYHSSLGIVETYEELAAPFFYGMYQDDLAAMFINWEIMEFSPSLVVMQKHVEAAQARPYIISSYGGYLAVFYGDEPLMMELTGRSILSLPIEEQQRLEEGIEVFGNEELLRALEDFSS